jgi:SAM-dependent methyltransferase
MYGENPVQDAIRTLRAWASNQVARLAPRAYVRITGQTGRGEREGETADGIAEYFLKCFAEYFVMLGVESDRIPDYLRGKVLLEYGPGDIPGVALLMVAHGVKKVVCVDRFPMLSLSSDNAAVLDRLLGNLSPEARARGEAALRRSNAGAVTLDQSRIEYFLRPSGLSGLRETIDLVFSRAVLEHVDDVRATFADMEAALRPGGVAIHLVDLKSHGLHQRNPLDFLSWPTGLWTLMFSQKGVPNRWRVNHYRDVLRAGRLKVQLLAPTARAAMSDVSEVRPHLAAPFRDLPDEDLAWLGFWLVVSK